MRNSLALALVATVVTVGAVASDAHACGFFNYHDVRLAPPKPAPVPVAQVKAPPPPPVPANERIATADQRLEDEKLAEAATQVLLAFPAIQKSVDLGTTPLERRAHVILALAVVRGGGALAGVSGFSSARDADRSANLEWAVSMLRQVDALRGNDPVAQANLGEALAARAGYEDEALSLLGDLAQRDLIGSAHAYAALAKLRSGRGEALASDDATRRCEAMTKSPERVCKPAAKPSVVDTRLAVRD
jgi:hypothetical protein